MDEADDKLFEEDEELVFDNVDVAEANVLDGVCVIIDLTWLTTE